MPRTSKVEFPGSMVKKAAKYLERAAKYGEKERKCTLEANKIISTSYSNPTKRLNAAQKRKNYQKHGNFQGK